MTCGSELARDGVSSANIEVTDTTPSRASSLPQGLYGGKQLIAHRTRLPAIVPVLIQRAGDFIGAHRQD